MDNDIVNYKQKTPKSRSDEQRPCVIFANLANAVEWAQKQSFASVKYVLYGNPKTNIEYIAMNEFHPDFVRLRKASDIAPNIVYYTETNRRHEVLNLPDEELQPEIRATMKQQIAGLDLDEK